MEADVVVIGGGMAGAIAALRAAELGADVVLVRKGHGASAAASGTIDIAGPQNFLPLDPWDTLPSIDDRLKEILRTNALHPYSIIGGGREGLEFLRQFLHKACDFLVEKIPFSRFRGSYARNLALPSVLGTVKFSALAPASLAAGDLLGMRDAHLLLVGMSGLLLFQSDTCKQAIYRYSSLHSPRAISRIDVIDANIPRSVTALPSAPFEVAGHFDDPLVAEEFVAALNKRIHSGVTHIGFPPVLGLNNHGEVFEIFRRGLQPEVFELISPTFSVPGYRLQSSLEAALAKSTVRTVVAEIVDAEGDGRKVKNLLMGNRKAKRTMAGKNYVIATGKFMSGGIVANDFPKEPIFGLQLFSRNKTIDHRFIQDLLSWNVDGRQLFLSCGIHVDNTLRPLTRFGEPHTRICLRPVRLSANMTM